VTCPGLLFFLEHRADIDARIRREVHLGDRRHVDIAVGAKFVRVLANQRQDFMRSSKGPSGSVEVQALRRINRKAARRKLRVAGLFERRTVARWIAMWSG